jgi:predicted lactoylglutathione lyase
MRNLNISDMRRIAKERGGKCLSSSYVNGTTKLTWQCSFGHTWAAIPHAVRHQGSWCPVCAGRKRYKDISTFINYAKSKGGKCLSESVSQGLDKLKFECVRGHCWEVRASQILIQKTWCPTCFGRNGYRDISLFKKYAVSKGGRCLSETVNRSSDSLKFECTNGHYWEVNASQIRHAETWCPVCVGNVVGNIEDMREIAKAKGGECLSSKYIKSTSQLNWRCSEGHEWLARPNDIKQGKWCPVCAGNVKLTIDDMIDLAKERGGQFCEDTYRGANHKHRWKCSEGHEWSAIPNSVRRGTWCPICSDGIGERICREYFEQLFNRKFPKKRPNWLLSAKGTRMELDGFCEELGLAFEHHGLQHYKILKKFGMDEQKLVRRRSLDSMKRELCKANNVLLVEVPEIPTVTPTSKIRALIADATENTHIVLPANFNEKNIDLASAYNTCKAKDELTLLKEIAEKKSGKVLSKQFRGATSALDIVCSHGHQWQTTAHKLKSGRWCPICGGTAKKTIEDMHQLAKARGGQFLSDRYINGRTKYKWYCHKGHEWEAVSESVFLGTWCPHCAHNKPLSLDEMKKIAISRSGRCLSRKYLNSNSKLLWECQKGHRWEATPSSIKNGKSWCPNCAAKVRVEMRRKS